MVGTELRKDCTERLASKCGVPRGLPRGLRPLGLPSWTYPAKDTVPLRLWVRLSAV